MNIVQMKKKKIYYELKNKYNLNADALYSINERQDILFMHRVEKLHGRNCIVTLELRDSIYNAIIYEIGYLDDKFTRKNELLELLNNINNNNVLLKFYISEENMVCGSITYIASGESFKAKDYFALMGTAFRNINDKHYNEIISIAPNM